MSNAKSTKPLHDQLAELDVLLAWFDKPDLDLDEALQKFDEGVKLVEGIKKQLGTLENKITVLKQKFDQNAA